MLWHDSLATNVNIYSTVCTKLFFFSNLSCLQVYCMKTSHLRHMQEYHFRVCCFKFWYNIVFWSSIILFTINPCHSKGVVSVTPPPIIFPGSTKMQIYYAKILCVIVSSSFAVTLMLLKTCMVLAPSRDQDNHRSSSVGWGHCDIAYTFRWKNAQKSVFVTSKGKLLQCLYHFLSIWLRNISSFIIATQFGHLSAKFALEHPQIQRFGWFVNFHYFDMTSVMTSQLGHIWCGETLFCTVG